MNGSRGRHSGRWRGRAGAALAIQCSALLGACELPPADPLPPDSFAFGVFGDGPYRAWQNGRFRRLIEDVNRADLAWLLHVGDIFWYPCTEDAYQDRLARMNAIGHPVVYTPGDNEWTDCHEPIPGGWDPLGRLDVVRRIFFDDPDHSLGGTVMPVTSQAADSAFSEFVENARWTRGGFVFATVHIVGSHNGTDGFDGRTTTHDSEVERRTDAAIAWMAEAFEVAGETTAKGVVLALHGNPGMDTGGDPLAMRRGFERFVEALESHVAAFPGKVLMIHGDSHTQRMDRPLTDRNGRPYQNFTRLETFGAPDIGWVRVVVDTVAGEITRVEPRLMQTWWF